ncbi:MULTISPECIES: hypothetical protein [unclassified Streptomyces]|uniref:hypothetical protein n=1 Tax=unclassified Streptomyces TaxID=2593676 RepID=UPI0031FDB0D8
MDDQSVALLGRFAGLGRLAVAYSGGADSALVLAAAVRALGPDRVLAVTAVSESLASGELAAAAELAASLGVVHLAPPTRELDRPGYRANGPDHCYFCKSEVLGSITAFAAERGFGWWPPAPTRTTRRTPSAQASRRAGRTGPHPAARHRTHQGRCPADQPPVGAAHLGQTRDALPGQSHRLRCPGHRPPAGPRRPGRGRRAGPAGRVRYRRPRPAGP